MKLVAKIDHPSKSLTSYELHIYPYNTMFFYHYWPNGHQFTVYYTLNDVFAFLDKEGGKLLCDKMLTEIERSMPLMSRTIESLVVDIKAIKTVPQE